MWQLLLNLIGGPIISGALEAYKVRLKAADNDGQRALELLQKEVEADIAARAAATKLLIAEQGRWYTAAIRPLFAAPFVIFSFKVIVWDKVLGLGVTDALDPNMWGVFQVVVVSYFGASTVERVTRLFRRS